MDILVVSSYEKALTNYHKLGSLKTTDLSSLSILEARSPR